MFIRLDYRIFSMNLPQIGQVLVYKKRDEIFYSGILYSPDTAPDKELSEFRFKSNFVMFSSLRKFLTALRIKANYAFQQ